MTTPITPGSVEGLRIRLQLAREGLLRLRALVRSGAELDHLAARIQQHHRAIESLRKAQLSARVAAMEGWSATLSGTPGATLSELAAEEQLMLRVGAQRAAERRAAQQAASTVSKGRWVGLTTPVAITLAAVLAIVAVGLYANSRQQSVLEQSRQGNAIGEPIEPFIGPDPIYDDCAPNVATQHGLLWTREAGWRAPGAEPQPVLYEYFDRSGETTEAYDQYLLDMADWEGRVRERVAEMFLDVERECGAGAATGRFDLSGEWTLTWMWSVTTVDFVGEVSGGNGAWAFDGVYSEGGNAIWTPTSGSARCTLTGDPLDPSSAAGMECTAEFPDGEWTGTSEGTFWVYGAEVMRFQYDGSGSGSSPTDEVAAIDELSLRPPP